MKTSKPLLTIEDVLPHLHYIRSKKQEYILCLSLDSGNGLIARRVVTIGTLTQSLIHPREVFAGPIKDRAASIILAHNHPPRDPSPSMGDISSTQQIIAAGIILSVKLADHIIVTTNDQFSFMENKLLDRI